MARSSCAVAYQMNSSKLLQKPITDEVDWVDPETAEVQRVDGLQHTLINYAANAPDFITMQTTMIESVFRILLSNGNTPITPSELSERLNRPPTTILRTLSGRRVYKGIRACPECI